jgi:hypothetical protein
MERVWVTILCASDIFLLLLQNIASWRGIAYLRTLGGKRPRLSVLYHFVFVISWEDTGVRGFSPLEQHLQLRFNGLYGAAFALRAI